MVVAYGGAPINQQVSDSYYFLFVFPCSGVLYFDFITTNYESMMILLVDVLIIIFNV